MGIGPGQGEVVEGGRKRRCDRVRRVGGGLQRHVDHHVDGADEQQRREDEEDFQN